MQKKIPVDGVHGASGLPAVALASAEREVVTDFAMPLHRNMVPNFAKYVLFLHYKPILQDFFASNCKANVGFLRMQNFKRKKNVTFVFGTRKFNFASSICALPKSYSKRSLCSRCTYVLD